MPIIILAFFCGILFYSLIYQSIYWLGLIGLLSYLCYRFHTVKIALAFFFGILWIFLQITWQHTWSLPTIYENQLVLVKGNIASLPITKNGNTHFLFAVEKFVQPHQTFIHKGLVTCVWVHAPPVTVGETWQLPLKLKKIHSVLNPGGLDYEAFAFAHRIRATAIVLPKIKAFKLSQAGFNYPIDQIRQLLALKIDALLRYSQMKGLIKALIIGEQSDILDTQWLTMRQTGTNHLFAIAGLHIGFVAYLTQRACSWAAKRSVWLMTRFSAPVVGSIGGLVAALSYSALAGFSLPTQRAVIMLTVFLIARIRQRYLGFWQSWLIALGIITLINPLQILTDSFWLSFAAVGSLIYSFQSRIHVTAHHFIKKITHVIKTQWVTSVALLPLTLLLFQQASLVSFFANFIAIPWVGFCVAPLSLLSGLLLLSFPLIGEPLLCLANRLLEMFWPILQGVGNLPYTQWVQVVLNPWCVAAAVIATLVLLAPRGFPARWLGCLWLLPLVSHLQSLPQFGEVAFTLLDVGQGLATVIRTQQHTLIFDTGAHRLHGFDAGESVLLPFLRAWHIDKIDTLLISHGDNDHIGGADTLLRTLPIKQIITSVPERFPHRSVFTCLAGQTWWWDGVKFAILYPSWVTAATGNNRSCVLKITTPAHTILLTGDIEKPAEQALVATYGKKLAADLLVVPHHGSKTSSTTEFIQAVSPKVALFPVGYLNQYHLPSPLIVQRYQQAGISTYDSVTCGTISALLGSKNEFKIHCYRQENPRFWRDNDNAISSSKSTL